MPAFSFQGRRSLCRLMVFSISTGAKGDKMEKKADKKAAKKSDKKAAKKKAEDKK